MNNDNLAALYGNTLTIGDFKLTLTDEQVKEWSELDIIYPCGSPDHGWHLTV